MKCDYCGRELELGWCPVCDAQDDPVRINDPLDNDVDQENPCEYSEGYDWSRYDWDNDPDWR